MTQLGCELPPIVIAFIAAMCVVAFGWGMAAGAWLMDRKWRADA